jgi:hypothetical protein
VSKISHSFTPPKLKLSRNMRTVKQMCITQESNTVHAVWPSYHVAKRTLCPADRNQSYGRHSYVLRTRVLAFDFRSRGANDGYGPRFDSQHRRQLSWLSDISGSHDGEYEDHCLLGCRVRQSHRNWQTNVIRICDTTSQTTVIFNWQRSQIEQK